MKKEFTVERDGRTFVLYAGLLDLAHERGLKSIVTTLVQVPGELNGNVAVIHATVTTEQGTFDGLGDAAPNNVNRMMAPHLIRLAETRAKARALRDATNIGTTALEELGGDGGDEDAEDEAMLASAAVRQSPPRSEPRTRGASAAPPQPSGSWPGHAGSGDASPKSLGNSATPAAPAAPAASIAAATAPTNGAAPVATAAPAGGPPPSPRQLETIARMARAAGKSVETEGISRAQASEIISGLIGEMGERRAN